MSMCLFSLTIRISSFFSINYTVYCTTYETQYYNLFAMYTLNVIKLIAMKWRSNFGTIIVHTESSDYLC